MTEALLARMAAPLGAAVLIAVVLLLLRRGPAIGRLLGPLVTLAAVGNLLLVAGPALFGPYFHYFTWEVPRR